MEKIQIQVEDAPLHIQSVRQAQDYLIFETTQQDSIILNAQNPLEMRYKHQQWQPYLYVRYGLWALVQRSVFYHLIELGDLQENAQGDTILSLKSGDFSMQISTPLVS